MMALWGNNTQPSSDGPDPERAAESDTALILAVVTVFHVVALVFVGLRIYARAWIIRSFGRDDAVVVCAALCAVGGWIIFIIQAQHGLGHHIDTISATDGFIFRQTGFWQTIVVSNWAMCFLKVSIALNLLRFCSSARWYLWSLWGMIGFVAAYTFIYFILQLVHCVPTAGFWDKNIKAQCFSIPLYTRIAIANTVLSMSTDVVLSILPIPIIWNLRQGLKVRIYLVVVLSLGYFTVALGVVKAVYQYRFAAEKDQTYNLSVPFWGFLQLQCGIIAASSVSLRPIVGRVLNLRSTFDKSAASMSRSNWHRGNLQPSAYKTSKKMPSRNEYELEEGTQAFASDTEGVQDNAQAYSSGGTSSFYNGRHEDSCSEDITIIQGVNAMGGRPARHIVRTTEVSVKYHV